MIVLGIESSCDDTAAAVLRDGQELSSVVASQEEVHGPYGGVVPELAARNHIRHVVPVIETALVRAGIELGDVDAVAATRGPGLVGSLLVGLCTAKAIARRHGLPFVGVNHIEGHLLSIELEEKVERPFLGLVVSGGHSALYWAGEDGRYALLGQTRDDAAGEAFDKAAKLLGLGYPGGRAIEQVARDGDPDALPLPRPRVRGADLDLSFSGLKTALRLGLEKHPNLPLADVAASFQRAVVDTLLDLVRRAIDGTGATRVVVTGGVSANGALREAMARLAEEQGARLLVPPLRRCTDNAAMIAYAGWLRLQRGERDPLTLNAAAELPLGPRVHPNELRA
ncbi:MAG TPA: tRNA (adenosine(37)-N6)-threonylcarbamoyltransferase complex transferase subunit TsaD [Candidatus Binatia bacterium]